MTVMCILFQNQYKTPMGLGPPLEYCVAAVLLVLYFWFNPQGVAFTYAWWLLIALSWISGELDCKCLTTSLGAGLVGSWYVSQVVYPEVWPRLMPYWNEKCGDRLSPHTVGASVRIGDIFLHLVPAMLLIQSYAYHCRIRHAVYAWLYERLWWVLMEASPFGSGVTANGLYDFRPRMSSDLFRTAQGVSSLLYFLPVILGLQGQVRLVCWVLFASALLNVCWDTPLVGAVRQRVVMPSTPVAGLLVSRRLVSHAVLYAVACLYGKHSAGCAFTSYPFGTAAYIHRGIF